MFKLHVRKIRISMFVLLGALTLALALLVGLSLINKVSAATPSAPSSLSIFSCSPVTVAAFTNRVHVSCNPAAGSIAYFAYCSTKDSANANRFLSLFTTAKVTGKAIYIYYNPNDTSGTSCGCNSGNCRVIEGAEVRP